MKANSPHNELSGDRTAKIIVFPLNRRLGKIRRVLDVMEAMHSKPAELVGYLRMIRRTLGDQMRRAGVPEDEIRRQVEDFFDAISDEIYRPHQHQDFQPDGAA